MEKTLTSIYLDPSQPASFDSLDAVYGAIKEKGKNKIQRKQVRDWLSQQDVFTLHKPARRRYKRSRVVVFGIDEQFQADLVDLQNLSRYNKGYIENTSWKVLAYGIYARVVDVSEIERVSAANE